MTEEILIGQRKNGYTVDIDEGVYVFTSRSDLFDFLGKIIEDVES